MTEAENKHVHAEQHGAKAIELAGLFENSGGHWPAVSQDVAEGRASVTMVYHDPGGGWWFDSQAEDESWVPQCLTCLLTRHPEMAEHADLPLNWVAWAEGGKWTRGPRPEEWGPWESD